MDDFKPSYYAVIPASVRYDKDISPNAKLLFGEITSLCNQKGYCWATNDYFSTLYGVSDRTIRTLLKQLQDKNYIKISIINNTKRLIYIDFTTPEENFLPPRKKTSMGMEENFLHNIKNNNKKEYEKINIKELEDLVNSYDWLEL